MALIVVPRLGSSAGIPHHVVHFHSHGGHHPVLAGDSGNRRSLFSSAHPKCRSDLCDVADGLGVLLALPAFSQHLCTGSRSRSVRLNALRDALSSFDPQHARGYRLLDLGLR